MSDHRSQIAASTALSPLTAATAPPSPPRDFHRERAARDLTGHLEAEPPLLPDANVRAAPCAPLWLTAKR